MDLFVQMMSIFISIGLGCLLMLLTIGVVTESEEISLLLSLVLHKGRMAIVKQEIPTAQHMHHLGQFFFNIAKGCFGELDKKLSCFLVLV
jgi:hypothetical protein